MEQVCEVPIVSWHVVLTLKPKLRVALISYFTKLLFDFIVSRVTGKAYHNALVWNDTRTADICDKLAVDAGGDRDRFRASTGLPLSPYFSGSKMMYLLDKVGRKLSVRMFCELSKIALTGQKWRRSGRYTDLLRGRSLFSLSF